MTILLIIDASIARLPASSQRFRELWGCWEEPNGYGELHPHNITPIVSNNTATGSVNVMRKLNSSTLSGIVYGGQHVDCISGTLIPLCGGNSKLAQDEVLSHPVEHVIGDDGDELDDLIEAWD
jgi:hypothetical protein